MTKKFNMVYETIVNEDIILESKINDLFSNIINKIVKKVKQDKINIQGKPLSNEANKVLNDYIKMKSSDNFIELMKSKSVRNINSNDQRKILNKVQHIKSQTEQDLKQSGHNDMKETKKFIALDPKIEHDIDEIIQDNINNWKYVDGVYLFKH
jgi:hypothetical protein